MIIRLKNIRSKVIIESSDRRYLFRDLRSYCSYLDKNRYYSLLYQSGKWDGKHNMITETGFFLTGLCKVVINFAEQQGSKVTIVDERKSDFSFNDTLNFIFKDIELREYQSKPIVKLKSKTIKDIPFCRGIVDAATNAGKDYIMAFIHLNLNCKTILVVHNQDLFDKAIKFFSKFFEVGYVSSKGTVFKDFTICMQKTLSNRMAKDVNIKKAVNEVNCLFVDECHRASGKDYFKLVNSINCPIRLGFSGTSLAFDDPSKKLKMIGMFGPVFYRLSNKFLIDNGFSQRPVIKVYDIPVSLPVTLNYRDDYENNVMFSNSRANVIRELIEDRPNKQILITVKEIEHGDYIFNKLLLSNITVKVGWVHGKDKQRAQKLQDFADCKINVLIASMIVKEGLNIPCINSIFMAQGGKSVITVKQITGRGLRHDDENDDFELVEFYDRGKWTKQHSKKRFKIYKNEEFDVEFQYKASKLGVPYEKKK